MKIIKKQDKEYPTKLLKIPNPPKQLYVEGNIGLLNKNSIAIVGSRLATDYGISCAKLFSSQLSKQNLTIVSGLAVGIDSIAHIYSMEEQGKTIAVLGSGFNNIYPEQNYYLYKKILEKDGCIITEYPPETQKCKENFPKRNRIISGLSLGVLLVEARYGSGGAITAKLAIKQGKDLFCIPNRIDEKTGYSTNLLIKQGANLVTCVQDIIDFYAENIDEENIDAENINTENINKENINIENINIENIQTKKLQTQEQYKQIYNLIGQLPISTNELVRITNKPITQISEALCMLEIEGLIKNIYGNQYIRNTKI